MSMKETPLPPPQKKNTKKHTHHTMHENKKDISFCTSHQINANSLTDLINGSQ